MIRREASAEETNMEAKHTPGPWEFEPDTGCIATADRFVGHPVAYVAGSRPERMENGRLIAAAPDMLEACIVAQQECIGLAAYLGTCAHDVILDNLSSTTASLEAKAGLLAAAIRKAKGE